MAGVRVPEPHDTVRSGSRYRAASRVPAYAFDLLRRDDASKQVSPPRIPELDSTICAAARYGAAIRAPCDRAHGAHVAQLNKDLRLLCNDWRYDQYTHNTDYHSRVSPIRNRRGPDWSSTATSPATLLITAVWTPEVMLVFGLA